MKIRFCIVLLLALVAIMACKNKTSSSKYSDEGSVSNPVLIVVNTPHAGTVGSYGTSFYKFIAAGTGLHTIALTNTMSDLSWDLYSNADYTTGWITFCDDYYGPADEIDTASLSSGVTYYLLVDEWDYVDGTFTLTVTY